MRQAERSAGMEACQTLSQPEAKDGSSSPLAVGSKAWCAAWPLTEYAAPSAIELRI
jgi:hypothetical protein